MIYVSWAALYEGASDRSYYDVLIPRLMEEIILKDGIRAVTIPPNPAKVFSRRESRKVAEAACEAKEAFHLLFIHADKGGRNLAAELPERSCAICEATYDRCQFPLARCVVIAPLHETEAWVLADPTAVTAALGYSGSAFDLDLPPDARAAERLVDPKAVLNTAVRQVRGRRSFSVHQIFPAIAQRQSIQLLRGAPSFHAFEVLVKRALSDIGCVGFDLSSNQ